MHLKDLGDEKEGIILNVDDDDLNDEDEEVATVNEQLEIKEGSLTAVNFALNASQETPGMLGIKNQVSREGTSMTIGALGSMEQVGGQLLNKDKTPQRARKRNDKSGLTTITSTATKNGD